MNSQSRRLHAPFRVMQRHMCSHSSPAAPDDPCHGRLGRDRSSPFAATKSQTRGRPLVLKIAWKKIREKFTCVDLWQRGTAGTTGTGTASVADWQCPCHCHTQKQHHAIYKARVQRLLMTALAELQRQLSCSGNRNRGADYRWRSSGAAIIQNFFFSEKRSII